MWYGTELVYRLGRFVGLATLGTLALVSFRPDSARGEDARPDAALETPADKAPTDGSIRLEYKFQSGQFVHYSGSHRAQYAQTIEDQTPNKSKFNPTKTYTTLQQNETGTHFRVVTVDEQGNALIEPVLDRARMTAHLPEKQPVSFDSELGGTPDPVFAPILEKIGRPVARFLVSRHGELLKATIVDATPAPGMREAAEKLDTRFAFLVPLPKTAVKVGDKWHENYSTLIVVDKGLKQPVPIRRIYELVSVTDGIALIKFKTVLLARLDDPEQEKQVAQQTPRGSVEFDIKLGLVRSHVSNVNQTVLNAFGPQSLLQVVCESTEKLIPAADAANATTKK